MNKQLSNPAALSLSGSLILFFLCSCMMGNAQNSAGRTITRINDNWLFCKGKSLTENNEWQNIRLPHTWNTEDVMDDIPGYYRGPCWYKRTLFIGSDMKAKQLSLLFEGVNQEAEVYINGRKAGMHRGGYTAFTIDITPFLRYNANNEITVQADNSFNADIPPLTADFSFYGGIYRDVFLIVANSIHFNTNDYGSNGVYITTPFVSNDHATVNIKSLVTNQTSKSAKIKITTSVIDNKGVRVATTSSVQTLSAFSGKSIIQIIPSIKHPELWSPEKPYLYTVRTSISDASGRVIDIVSNPIGFRWFHFDAEKGFFLNGHVYKLTGASRHQDYKGLGNAVPDELAVRDVILLKKMGANFLRVAHYPQDPCILNACDSLGLLASVEIPIVNEITESDSFYRHCEQMQVEMIRQNFNHPSVVLWCYMNEVLLRPHFPDDKERQKLYFSRITALAQRLEDLTRKEDPSRYTMMANHGNLDQYKNAGLLHIPMVVGWNLYSGWYGGSMEGFPAFLDAFHRSFPGISFMVTEYGADADPRIRSNEPVRFDKSIEYTTRFHQFYLSEMLKRPFVAGAIVWNLADFNSETRSETMPHINNKGLLQWDRTPKDPYYFYQAMLSGKPFIKILGSEQNLFGVADSGSSVCYLPLQVASNMDSVVIIVNGKRKPAQKIVNGICEWKLPFRDGWNTIIAEGKKSNLLFIDSMGAQIHLQPHCLSDMQFPFKQLNVILGTTRYFTGEKGAWWQPDQAYQKGRWGSVGGTKFKLGNNDRLPYGTDKNIMGTDDDPVYQTQQTGIRQYRLDVPAGEYKVILHFAELLGGKVRIPPYNLNNNEREEKEIERIFNVHVNGKPLLQHFDIAREYGLATAVTKSAIVIVKDSEGVFIDFEAVEGEPVLNALQLIKLNQEVEK